MNTLQMRSCLTAYLGAALLASLFTGCSAYKRVADVNPIFLEGVDVHSKIDNLPFDQAWVKDDFDGRKYSKLIIKPIRTDLLTGWERSMSAFIASKESYDLEARKIADYFHAQLVKDIEEYNDNRILVTEKAGADVLTMEIALTELEFSHPVARAAALAAPVPGTGAALATITDPHAAFAARITDPSGRLVATVADRKFPPTRIIDLNKLMVTSSVREVSSIWAKTMAEALNKGRFQKTEREGRFSILPW